MFLSDDCKSFAIIKTGGGKWFNSSVAQSSPYSLVGELRTLDAETGVRSPLWAMTVANLPVDKFIEGFIKHS